jgi:hypothetical protein
MAFGASGFGGEEAVEQIAHILAAEGHPLLLVAPALAVLKCAGVGNPQMKGDKLCRAGKRV